MLTIKDLFVTSLVVVAADEPIAPAQPAPPTAPEKPREKPKFGAGKKGARPQPPPMNKSLRPRRRG